MKYQPSQKTLLSLMDYYTKKVLSPSPPMLFSRFEKKGDKVVIRSKAQHPPASGGEKL